MLEAKGPDPVVWTTTVAGRPGETEAEAGVAAIVKSAAVVDATVRESDAVRVSPPPVPVTFSAYVPGGVVAKVETERVDVPVPGSGIVGEEKAAVAPEGSPLTESATAEPKPPLAVEVTVVEAERPVKTERDAGETETERSGMATL